jgi:rhodanese-related sulfurtransferase
MVTWQLAAVLLVAAAIGLTSNHLRTARLPLIGDWSPEAQSTTPSGESLAISLAEAEELYYARAAVFLDARAPEQFNEGHIDGALNLPWEAFHRADLDTRVDEVLWGFSPKTRFIAYCDGESCSLSRELAMFLLDRGYTEVCLLVNGWTLWNDRGLPVDKGPAGAVEH